MNSFSIVFWPNHKSSRLGCLFHLRFACNLHLAAEVAIPGRECSRAKAFSCLGLLFGIACRSVSGRRVILQIYPSEQFSRLASDRHALRMTSVPSTASPDAVHVEGAYGMFGPSLNFPVTSSLNYLFIDVLGGIATSSQIGFMSTGRVGYDFDVGNRWRLNFSLGGTFVNLKISQGIINTLGRVSGDYGFGLGFQI